MASIGRNAFQRRKRISRVLFIFLVIVSLILLLNWRSDNQLLSTFKSKLEQPTASVLNVLSAPARGVESLTRSVQAHFNTVAENKRLKAELDQLADVEMRANAMATKLSRLEAILNIDAASGIPERKIAARAVTETNGPFVRSVLINAGTEKGVSKGNAVLTTSGMLGHVIRVGPHSARVLRLEDLNSRIAVMSQRSKARAILTGTNDARPHLSFVAELADWQEGDLVVSSGDDGLLPAGLPIGTVTDTRDTTYPVTLFNENEPIDWVWVYPFEPIEAPIPQDMDASMDAVPIPAEEAEDDDQVPQANSENVVDSDESEPLAAADEL